MALGCKDLAGKKKKDEYRSEAVSPDASLLKVYVLPTPSSDAEVDREG
jgi:hypothetical protein